MASDARLARLCAFEVVVLLAIVAILRARGWSTRDLTIGPSLANTVRGVLLLALSLLAYWTVAFAVRGVTGSFEFAYRVRLASTASVPVIMLTSTINPVFEESIVVAYVLRFLRAQPAILAVSTSALLRLLYHVYQGPLAFVAVLPVGILFATYYRWRPVLWPLFVAHALADFMGLIAARYATY